MNDTMNPPSDEELVEQILQGEVRLFGLIMRRHNQRLYRTARSIVRDDDEAEDVMQEAYVQAYAHLRDFEGRARFATWLTRITVHEALARSKKSKRQQPLDEEAAEQSTMSAKIRNPEQCASDHEIKYAIERAVDALPDGFREVFVLRAVEGLSIAETAECLELNEDTVKTRLHRARTALQKQLLSEMDAATPKAFDFHLSRCDRVVHAVLSRIGSNPPSPVESERGSR